MNDILSFLSQCETLTGGQSPAQIFHKAIVLIEDPIYWCGAHKACIRHFHTTPDGRAYYWDVACRINDPRATCVNVEGAVARACNNEGIIPPYLLRYLDESVLAYLKEHNITGFGENCDAWNPYDIGWFCEYFGHEHAMNLLHEIYGRVS